MPLTCRYRSWGDVKDQEILSWGRYENWKSAVVPNYLGLTLGSSLTWAARGSGVRLHQWSSTKGSFAQAQTLWRTFVNV